MLRFLSGIKAAAEPGFEKFTDCCFYVLTANDKLTEVRENRMDFYQFETYNGLIKNIDFRFRYGLFGKPKKKVLKR